MRQQQYDDPCTIDTTWTAQEDSAPLAVRRNTFVPAPRTPTQVQQPAPLEAFNVQSPAQSLVRIDSSYEDRSRGFVWVTLPVAATVGVLSCVAGVALFRTPVLSFGILTWFLTAFCATWIVAWVSHLAISPDGAALWSSLALWRTVSREQQFRHDRYWQEYTDARRDNGLDVRPAARRRR